MIDLDELALVHGFLPPPSVGAQFAIPAAIPAVWYVCSTDQTASPAAQYDWRVKPTVSFKDLFSPQAADYARFRPVYPPPLFAWLAAQVPERRLAIDVGAGTGQASVALAAHFRHVLGIEPSDAQRASAARYVRSLYEGDGARAGNAR